MAYSYNNRGRGDDYLPPNPRPDYGQNYGQDYGQDRAPPNNWNMQNQNQYQGGPPVPGKYNQQGGYQSGPSQGGYGGYQSGPPPGQGGGYGQGMQHGNPNQYGGFLPSRPTPVVQRSPHNDRLWEIFKSVDTDNSNCISERELADAFVNADYQRFDPLTIQMMIKMFDVDRSGTINFPEFCMLWDYLSQWRRLFDGFDKDRSGAISLKEFSLAIKDFGYTLSPEFMQFFFNVYVPRGQSEISFDLFVQACVTLQRLTGIFESHDKNHTGVVTMTFEKFLAACLRVRE